MQSPCGACKFLRRKCAGDCVFAPYFCSEQGPVRFAAIHKVFGASNISKLLLRLPPWERCEAVVTITYEAQARIRDPVYGCVSDIFSLQQQVAYLQAQLMQVKAQMGSTNMGNNHCHAGIISTNIQTPIFPNNNNNNNNNSNNYYNYNYNYSYMNPISPQSSMESMVMSMHEAEGVIETKTEGIIGKKRSLSDMDELQEVALRMMRPY